MSTTPRQYPADAVEQTETYDCPLCPGCGYRMATDPTDISHRKCGAESQALRQRLGLRP